MRILSMVVALLSGAALSAQDVPKELLPYCQAPAKYANDLGAYRSPLLFNDGTTVKTAADWGKRRQEILQTWHGLMGAWPPLVTMPTVDVLQEDNREQLTQQQLRLQIAPDRTTEDAHLLIPPGKGPFPAVVVVFYESKTGIGLGKAAFRDFAYQLAQRGFVALSLGSDPNTYYPSKEKCQVQPLSFHAYVAANCYNMLANRPDVDAKRIGIVGHSYGGKWAMFAACLYDKFAATAWSDAGIVFDERRGNVNYWEPWYLGHDPSVPQRARGIPNDKNPRTGPYKKMLAEGRDLHELHALMAPRPFLVSGGSEDPPERWQALNHTVAVNKLLGAERRVAMTNRPMHDPNEESNALLYLFMETMLKAKK
jgi:hypothetical protein